MRDPDTGLIYLRSRWYDPVTKQFLSPDPLGVANADVNPYRYGGNNPVENSDPSGLDYVTTRDGIAYWAIEKPGLFRNKDVNWIPLGRVVDGVVHFNDRFAGGTMALEVLERNAENVDSERDISSSSYKQQEQSVRTIIDRIRRGSEIEREPSGATAVVGAYYDGAQAGFLQIADTVTFRKIDRLNEANAAAWDDIGLAGTWTQTISGGAAVVFREAAFTALTLGTGSAIQAARGAAAGARAATTAAQLGGTASKTRNFINISRSPLVQGTANLAGRSPGALRTLQRINTGARLYEATSVGIDAYDGYQMIREGNPWGWLSIALAGTSGVVAGVGGYGGLRRLGGAGGSAPAIVNRTSRQGLRYQNLEYRRFRSQGYSAAASRRLIEPYRGMGQHFIQKAWLNRILNEVGEDSTRGKLLAWYRDSAFNVVRGRNMNTGRFYEYHARLHGLPAYGPRTAQGMRLLPNEPWRAANVMPVLDPYDRLGYLWHGSPTALKLTAGVVVGSSVWSVYELFDED